MSRTRLSDQAQHMTCHSKTLVEKLSVENSTLISKRFREMFIQKRVHRIIIHSSQKLKTGQLSIN